MLRHCSASTLSDVEGSTLLRAMSPSTLLRTVSPSNGPSNGRWAFSDSLIIGEKGYDYSRTETH